MSKPSTMVSDPPSPAVPEERGCFAADCANAALREETKKLYAAIFKGLGAKEGPWILSPSSHSSYVSLSAGLASYLPAESSWGRSALSSSSWGRSLLLCIPPLPLPLGVPQWLGQAGGEFQCEPYPAPIRLPAHPLNYIPLPPPLRTFSAVVKLEEKLKASPNVGRPLVQLALARGAQYRATLARDFCDVGELYCLAVEQARQAASSDRASAVLPFQAAVVSRLCAYAYFIGLTCFYPAGCEIPLNLAGRFLEMIEDAKEDALNAKAVAFSALGGLEAKKASSARGGATAAAAVPGMDSSGSEAGRGVGGALATPIAVYIRASDPLHEARARGGGARLRRDQGGRTLDNEMGMINGSHENSRRG